MYRSKSDKAPDPRIIFVYLVLGLGLTLLGVYTAFTTVSGIITGAGGGQEAIFLVLSALFVYGGVRIILASLRYVRRM